MSNVKIFLEVPFAYKEIAKKGKCKFDSDVKKWYATSEKNPLIAKYLIAYYNVPYDLKDKAKALGARWDMDRKQWYSYQGNDLLIALLDEECPLTDSEED